MRFKQYIKEAKGLLIGYKVMKYDPKTKTAISIVNDTTEKLKPKKGLIIKMPGKGLYLSSSKSLVIDFYALSDVNILLTLQYNEKDVMEKELNIFTVKKAKIIDFFIIDASGNKLNINEASKLKITDNSLGYQSGQMDMRLQAELDGKVVGYLDYTIYNDDVSIKYIEGSREHKGIGKELILKLQSMFPKTEIKLGMLTDKGSKLVKSIKSKLYVDRARINKLKRLKKELEKLNKIEADTIKSGDWSNWDNDIYDRQYELEQEIYNLEMK